MINKIIYSFNTRGKAGDRVAAGCGCSSKKGKAAS
jgi:hypothetical protein